MLSYSHAEPGRELTHPRKHLLAEPCTLWLPGKNRRLLLPVAPRLLVALLLPSNAAAGLALVVPLLREEVLLALLLVAGQRDGEAAVAGQDVVVVGLAAVAMAARGVLRGRRVAAVPEPGVLPLQRTENRE